MSARPRHARTSEEDPILSNDEDDYGHLAQSQMSGRSMSRSLTLPPPRDPQARKSIQTMFIILGASLLLPWNGLITATPYFLSRLADSSIRPAFGSYLGITHQAFNFLTLIYATLTAANASKTLRIRASSSALAILFFVLTLSTVSSTTGTPYFTLIMIIDALLGVSASMLSVAVVALAALFGPAAMQACFAGQAAVGVVVSFVQFMGAVIANDSPDGDSAKPGPTVVFFGLATAFVLFSLIAHSVLLRTPEYTEVVQKWEAGKVLLVEEPGGTVYVDDDEQGRDVEDERRGILSSADDLGVEVPQVKGRVSIWEIAKINKLYNLAVGFCFAVTLSVFPPITAYVAPTSSSMFTPSTFIAFHFLVFNVGDYLGRFACAYPMFQFWKRKQLASYSLSRVLFIPLILMCNVRAPGMGLDKTPLFNSDFIFFFLVFLLGFTNGHCCGLCMMSAPSTEHNGRIRSEQVDTAAMVAQFSLVGGLAAGSAASFAVRRMVCGCNPFLG
ncbi:Equilibrative nucleoside transporter 1 OS=Rattus norvegicus GN=Slc29a1 PE=2 SV=3 [Rhizoctonia solani AG-1 IB]|uniref:Equilibrative nucleoside transporter 1 n=1 Tax=Thanatephorus cucumeris (strain AG1-IB / isolate 7/3/14) TaxID=1108050 RepID=M5BS46_THACB|nr:Equilibrative nucleoside transporter 1 AltName: Full=Equilibrative nitrobenzylmercaptopurine riboside-sensitive nucleoside transporter [Rhizoctonia solani AG-1 IB]CEL59461.1 Equilibrative nucleoside transporter 1 OS=Rattus norvegicus GN=Slc29a1 PE=2 SV=3 [Rhizoctonia solani AG-1 IB]